MPSSGGNENRSSSVRGVVHDHPPVVAAGREQGPVAGQRDPANLADVGLRPLAGGVKAAEIQRQQVAAGLADHREALTWGDGELRHPPLKVAAADRRGRFQVVDGDQAAPRPDAVVEPPGRGRGPTGRASC